MPKARRRMSTLSQQQRPCVSFLAANSASSPANGATWSLLAGMYRRAGRSGGGSTSSFATGFNGHPQREGQERRNTDERGCSGHSTCRGSEEAGRVQADDSQNWGTVYSVFCVPRTHASRPPPVPAPGMRETSRGSGCSKSQPSEAGWRFTENHNPRHR